MLENMSHLRVVGLDRHGCPVREFTEFYEKGVDLNALVKDLREIYPTVVRVVLDAAV